MPSVEHSLVFLASPADVHTERGYVQIVLEELNRNVARPKDLWLEAKCWENDTFPGYGQDAQALINAQMEEMAKYALFIGIMWNRLGTPTPRAESGTVEEFERAVAALKKSGQPEIWFYFSKSASNLDTVEQLEQRKKVLDFRKRVQANGLTVEYHDPQDFKDKFRNQLTRWLNSRTRKNEETSQVGADTNWLDSEITKRVNQLYVLSISDDMFFQLKRLSTGSYGAFWLDPELRVGLAPELNYLKMVGYIKFDKDPKVTDISNLPKGDQPDDDLSRYISVTPQGHTFIVLREQALKNA